MTDFIHKFLNFLENSDASDEEKLKCCFTYITAHISSSGLPLPKANEIIDMLAKDMKNVVAECHINDLTDINDKKNIVK